MSRPGFVLALVLAAALGGGCDIDDPVPPPAPPSDRGPSPQPRPGPVDAGDTDDPFPGDGAPTTIDAADLSCGSFGDTCCTDGPACTGDFLHCDPDLGVCNTCGDIADDCCSEGPACQPGLTCNAGVCGP